MLNKVTTRAVLAAILLAPPILLAGTVAAGDVQTRDAREYFFAQTFGDLPEEMQAAREQGKLGMLLFFEADECRFCQHMLRKVFNQKHVQDWYQKRFVSIAVDIHGDVELTDFDGITLPSKIFAAHRQVFMTPVVSFLNLDGVEIYRHYGLVKTPEDMLLLGEYIAGDHFYDTEFMVFARSRGRQDDEGALVTPGADTE